MNTSIATFEVGSPAYDALTEAVNAEGTHTVRIAINADGGISVKRNEGCWSVALSPNKPTQAAA